MNKWLLFFIFLLIEVINWILYYLNPISFIDDDIYVLVGTGLEVIFLIILVWIFSKDSSTKSTIVGLVFTSAIAVIIWLPMALHIFDATSTDGAEIVPISYFFLGAILSLIVSTIVYFIRKKSYVKNS